MSWVFYSIAAAIVWGLDYSLCERIFNAKISPFSLLAIQMFVGSIIFFVIGLRHNLYDDIQLILHDTTLFWIILVALITFNGGNLLIFLSIQAKNATIAGLIELSYPLFTILFTWFLFRDHHVDLNLIIGGLLITSGVFYVALFSK